MILSPKNLFSALEADPTDKYESMDAAETYEQLQRDQISPSFYAELSADLETRDAIVANLQLYIDTAEANGDIATKVEASVLKADVLLNTSSAGLVVEELVPSLINIASMESASQTDVIAALMGPVAELEEAEFVAFVDQMRDIAFIYNDIGGDLGTTVVDIPAEIAQSATLAIVMDVFCDVIVPSEGETAGSVLYDAVQAVMDGDDTTAPVLSLSEGAETTIANTVAEGSSLLNILNAAGLSEFTNLMGDLL